jgi:KTSC domain
MRTLVGLRVYSTLLCAAWACSWPLSSIAGTTPGKKPAPGAVTIVRTAVESTSLISVGFAKEARILEIEFRTGVVYRYFAVPQSIFEEFKRAESKGRYFTQSIRGKYQFQRIEMAPK